jgi:hypothetical protein
MFTKSIGFTMVWDRQGDVPSRLEKLFRDFDCWMESLDDMDWEFQCFRKCQDLIMKENPPRSITCFLYILIKWIERERWEGKGREKTGPQVRHPNKPNLGPDHNAPHTLWRTSIPPPIRRPVPANNGWTLPDGCACILRLTSGTFGTCICRSLPLLLVLWWWLISHLSGHLARSFGRLSLKINNGHPV